MILRRLAFDPTSENLFGLDGDLRGRFVSATAFFGPLLALGGAGAVWAIHLGFAAMLGFNVTLLIG